MTVEVALETPLANALTAAVQPKLVEVGWASEEDGSALAEYIILMLVNGKTQDQIAAELSGELLSLPPDDPSSHNFARWLFEQIETLNAQMNGQAAAPVGAPQPDAADGEMDTDMGAGDVAELNAYVFSHRLIDKPIANSQQTHRTKIYAEWQCPRRTREAHDGSHVKGDGPNRRIDDA